jgi:hypothetical protein
MLSGLCIDHYRSWFQHQFRNRRLRMPMPMRSRMLMRLRIPMCPRMSMRPGCRSPQFEQKLTEEEATLLEKLGMTREILRDSPVREITDQIRSERLPTRRKFVTLLKEHDAVILRCKNWFHKRSTRNAASRTEDQMIIGLIKKQLRAEQERVSMRWCMILMPEDQFEEMDLKLNESIGEC